MVARLTAPPSYRASRASIQRYLETQLKDFNKRARTNDNAIMHSVASKLTELEIVAVSVYLGGLE